MEMISVDITVDENAISGMIENIVDDTLMLAVHNLLAKMCDPYVPYGDTGNLANSSIANITSEYIEYSTEYAHYMYHGLVYGPNYPIIKNGVIVGWYSPPLEKGSKYPTGKELQYNKEIHSKATSFWDKAMMTEQGDAFIKQVRDLMIRRAKELYG